MFCDDRDRSYGCLFCRTGREETTANELKRLFPEIEIIVPVKSRYWRHGGVAREEHVGLFPGYIFFQVDNAFDVFVFAKCNNVYSLLKAPSGDWKIRNEDRKIVEKLFASKGVIGFSKAYFEGNRIRITGVEEVTFAEGTTTVHPGLFGGCGLKRIVIPEMVTSIGNYAFAGCSELKEVVFEGDALTKIGYYAFANTAISTIELPAANRPDPCWRRCF